MTIYPALAATTFNWIDYAVLAGYFCLVLLVSYIAGRDQKTLKDYFVANRSMNGILVCVSILATDLSAIGFIGSPEFVFHRDLRYAITNALLAVPVMVVIAVVFVPIYHRLGVFTVNQYLEQRFHASARPLAALVFIMKRGVWMGTALFAPSVVLADFTGIHVIGCIFLIGLLVTVYIMFGGIKADIWNDFNQFIVMLGGLATMYIIMLSDFNWDVGAVWASAGSVESSVTKVPPTTMFDFSFNFHEFGTFWSLLFFMTVYNIGAYGTDQVIAQRYFTMGGLRQLIRTVVLAGLLGGVMTIVLAFLGILFVAYYNSNPDMVVGTESNRLVTTFISTHIPVGFRALLIAAIFAATFSSVGSGLNSVTTVLVMDLYNPIIRKKHVDDGQESLAPARILTAILGVLAMLTAVYISTRGDNVLKTVIQLASKFVGPITGIFFLGMFTRRGNIVGVFVGMAAGLTAAFLIDLDVIEKHVNWLWTAPLSSLTTFIVGYIASVVAPVARRPTPVKAVQIEATDRGDAAQAQQGLS